MIEARQIREALTKALPEGVIVDAHEVRFGSRVMVVSLNVSRKIGSTSWKYLSSVVGSEEEVLAFDALCRKEFV